MGTIWSNHSIRKVCLCFLITEESKTQNDFTRLTWKFKHNSAANTVIINFSAVPVHWPCAFEFAFLSCGVIVTSVSGSVVGTTQGSPSGPWFSGHPILYLEVHLSFLNHKYRGQKYSFMGRASTVRLSIRVFRVSDQGLLLPSWSIFLKKRRRRIQLLLRSDQMRDFQRHNWRNETSKGKNLKIWACAGLLFDSVAVLTWFFCLLRLTCI